MLSGCSKFIFDGEASLYSPCVLFLIYFLKVGLIFFLSVSLLVTANLFSLSNPFENHFDHPPHLSPLINTWNEAWMGWFWFLLSLLCFFCCSSPVLGIHAYLASDLPFSSEGEGYHRRLVLSPRLLKWESLRENNIRCNDSIKRESNCEEGFS